MPKPSRGSKGKASDSDSKGEGSDVRFQLSNNRFVSVGSFKGRLRVDIREFWINDKGEKCPGKKGLSLNLDEWKKFKDCIDDVDAALKKLDSDASESEEDD
ncbi:activated RNA polymerase II transcriptional coactivator p15-like [Panonychus citri]|uniref:activated RNA polymerase II transcriptional coactivator p15-like n=1 Tax=Panonychus citri TaxID=50023 RepID=UPI002307BAF9|nr:activated RNA polymerase II transcriptional coactivator p15-like [Panonychus citri]